MSYDIIGDIHGQADKLERLLALLGYRERDGTWRHPSRQAIFVGDFVDRGPRQLDTVDLVRRMVDGGHALAVMGNHEFNAIAWYLPDPDGSGDHLRTRRGAQGDRHRGQHEAFLAEVEHRPQLHREIIEWFLTLPLWLDLPGLRVVHACWHPASIAELEPELAPGRRLTVDLMAAASRKGSMEFKAVECLTKGLESTLPAGHFFYDKDDNYRTDIRVRWWDASARTYRQAAMLEPREAARLPDLAMHDRQRLGYDAAKPVFFGHYWMTGTPQPQAPNIACVDYSAANDGPLVAYRWDGEPALEAAHFVAEQ